MSENEIQDSLGVRMKPGFIMSENEIQDSLGVRVELSIHYE